MGNSTIRFLVTNAYAGGGITRTIITTANLLAENHDVEIVSVIRGARSIDHEMHPNVRVRTLVEPPKRERRETLRALRSTRNPLRRASLRARSRRDIAARARPSMLIHPWERRIARFNGLTDRRLTAYLRSLRGGVMVGTRVPFNALIASQVHRSVRCIGQEHMFLGLYSSVVRDSIAEFYPRLDMIVTLYEEDAEDYRRLLGAALPVRALPNAGRTVGSLRTDVSRPLVIAAGRLAPAKGFDRLIDAFALVARERPSWSLRIYGSGTLRPRLQRRIDRAGASDTITLMGYDKNLPERLAEASIFVLSSRHEGLPLVLLEAMGCGLPSVCFNSGGGTSSLVEHERTGLIVPDGDVDAMAQAIVRLADDADLRQAMSEAAWAKAQDFAPSRIGERWEQLLEELETIPSGQRRRRRRRLDWSGVPPAPARSRKSHGK